MAADRKASSLSRVWVTIHRSDLSSETEDKSKSVPRCVILPQDSPTPEIQDIFRVSLALQDENLVLKLRNNRGSLIPINGFITPNSKFQPYVLEVTRRYQNVKPMKRSVKINGYNDIIKQRLQQIVKRVSSSLMNAGNVLPIHGTLKELESSLTNPSIVVHQKLYDGNPVSNKGTSSNSVRKIVTKRRTSVAQCPSILAFVQTFLQMIIALAIILAGSPILVAGSDITERVTLQAGKPGVVPFHLQWSPNDTSQVVPFYTLQFESNTRPFSINGEVDIKGFKNPSQIRRFSTSVTDLDTSPCVKLMIDNVDTEDEDGYVLTAVWDTFENVRYETMKKEVDVQIQPGRAKCFITLSENVDYHYEVHCRATTGSVRTTLSCYHNDQMIDVRGDITDNGQVTSGIFLLPHITHFSCCAHDVTSFVSETTCDDFVWPRGKETTRPTVNTVPTSVTTPTPQIESHTGSGACRQFMLPSLWHFTYLVVYILAFVTIY